MTKQCLKMNLLLLLSLLGVTGGFAIRSPSHNLLLNRRIPLKTFSHEKGAPIASSSLLLLRGGGIKAIARRNMSSMEDSTPSPSNTKRKRTIAISVVATAILAFWGYEYRTPLAAAFNKQALQERVLTILHSFHGDWRGVALYTCGMTVWELLGMSTIPVETAAGMVFGFRVGFLASAGGKLAGAFLGFVLGRTVLKNFIGHKLESNKTIQLIQHHVNQNPYKVALLLRYSLLPEFVKNCGASLFEPITPLLFIASVMLHGWMYSACWTYLGVDTARRLETPGLPVDRLAQFGFLWATIVGMILTPMLMAWWIRDMQTSELNVIDDDNEGDNNNKKKKKKS